MQFWYRPRLACVNFHAKDTCQRKPVDLRDSRTGIPTFRSSAKMFNVVASTSMSNDTSFCSQRSWNCFVRKADACFLSNARVVRPWALPPFASQSSRLIFARSRITDTVCSSLVNWSHGTCARRFLRWSSSIWWPDSSTSWMYTNLGAFFFAHSSTFASSSAMLAAYSSTMKRDG